MTDEAFLAAFEAGTLPKEDFSHRQHVRLAWLYLRAHGFAEGSRRVVDGIRGFAALHDVPGLYHETVTRAWLRLIAASADGAATFEGFIAANPRLAAKGVLDAHYAPETLQSDEARRTFVPPDRAPLP